MVIKYRNGHRIMNGALREEVNSLAAITKHSPMRLLLIWCHNNTIIDIFHAEPPFNLSLGLALRKKPSCHSLNHDCRLFLILVIRVANADRIYFFASICHFFGFIDNTHKRSPLLSTPLRYLLLLYTFYICSDIFHNFFRIRSMLDPEFFRVFIILLRLIILLIGNIYRFG